MKKWLILLLMICSPFSLAFSKSDLIALLQQPTNIQGDFTQQRFLKSLPKPITTSGQFVLYKDHGLLWQMQKPFTSDIKVTHNGIMQWNNTQWIKNERIGQSEQINLFLGLLSGNISSLENQFSVDISGNNHQWILILTPTSLLMKQIFTVIQIQGDNTVKTIELQEKQGDRTIIQLHNQKVNQPLPDFVKNALE